MQAFLRAAEGIRTLDLLHGKQNVWFRLGADIPCKHMGSRVWVWFCDSPAFTGSSRGFRHRMGTRPGPHVPGLIEVRTEARLAHTLEVTSEAGRRTSFGAA
jgi:hypothetical protein